MKANNIVRLCLAPKLGLEECYKLHHCPVYDIESLELFDVFRCIILAFICRCIELTFGILDNRGKT